MRLIELVKKFIDYDCDVKLDDEFMIYPDGVISITISEDKEDNLVWKKFLKERFDFTLTNENLFTMSVLHELGHFYTIEYFTDEEWNATPEEQFTSNIERQYAHYEKPNEVMATEWAIAYYNANLACMRKWNHRFCCALRHLEKKNPVSNSLLEKI